MNDPDKWGKDPAVRAMRDIFRAMERAQNDFLGQMDIVPYDIRIRNWREKALAIFERAWGSANRIGVDMNARTAPEIYTRCLASVMASDGVKIPDSMLSPGGILETLLKEVLK